jgi:hypothetical protein
MGPPFPHINNVFAHKRLGIQIYLIVFMKPMRAGCGQIRRMPIQDRRNASGLALPEVVQRLLQEGSLRWDCEDSAYVVVDGDEFEMR